GTWTPRDDNPSSWSLFGQATAPQLQRGAGQFAPFRHRGQLGPTDLGVAYSCAEAAVRARHHVLRPDQSGEASQALSDQLRVLDLEDEASFDDRLVLRSQRLGRPEQERLAGRVVLVDETGREGAGPERGHEPLDGATLQRGAQPIRVGLDRVVADVLDRPDAG